MAIRLATATRNAMVDAWTALTNGGSIEVYSGTQPASAEDAAPGTLLATLTLPADAFADAVSGTASANADPDLETTGTADGTAGWARVKDPVGGTVFDGSVAISGGNFTINNASITIGGAVRLTSGSLTQPAG